MRTVIVLAACAPLFGAGARAAPQEQIGSWVLHCPDGEPCLLRAEKRFLDTSGITADLEVLADGSALVPVLALRGLTTEMLAATALAGRTEAWLQFGGGARHKLDCAPSTGAYICAPHDDAARALAADLPGARSVRMGVSVSVSGLKPLSSPEKSLALSGTGEALARLRQAGPTPVPGAMTALAAPSPGALMGIADKALKAAGYPNGLADMQGLIAKYRGK